MTKITFTYLDEFGEEKIKCVKYFETDTEADDFLCEHEQDFADNPEIYAVYRRNM